MPIRASDRVTAPDRRAPAPVADGWRVPYRPLVRQGDIQTVLARYWPQSLDEVRFPTEARLFRTEPHTKVLAKVSRQPGNRPEPQRPTVLAVHGLTACDRAPYMLSAARAALEAGFDVVRLNVRNCGGTEHLCRTLYHSGLTGDLASVVEQLAPRPLFLMGFSMGGNMALKLAGEWGALPPRHVRAVCAISPPVRLDLCSRNIGRPRNFVYEQRFLLQLGAALRRKHEAMPDLFPAARPRKAKSIWEFDEVFTAPAFGYGSARDYYRQCSAARFLDAIRLPSLIVHAKDDPFIPFEAFDPDSLDENPWITFLSPAHGGHVAFLARGPRRFWAQDAAVRYFGAILQQTHGQPSPPTANGRRPVRVASGLC